MPIDVEKAILEISKKSGKDLPKINDMIEDKLLEFSGMINKEAAVHLVARELDIELPKSDSAKLQIKNLVTGMRNVGFVGRIFKISPIIEFSKKSGDKGKVSNVFISDGTGYTRVPLWNDQVKMVEEEMIRVGDAVQIVGGMTKDNIYGEVEVSIGKFGAIKKIDDDEAPSLESVGRRIFSTGTPRVKIAELVPGTFEISGTIVNVFRGNFVFETDSGEKAIFISCSIDDGSGEIRSVFFKNLAEGISGLSAKDFENLGADEKLELAKSRVVGIDVLVSGKVKKNKFFDRLEMVADSVKAINPLEESKRIAQEIESKIGV